MAKMNFLAIFFAVPKNIAHFFFAFIFYSYLCKQVSDSRLGGGAGMTFVCKGAIGTCTCVTILQT